MGEDRQGVRPSMDDYSNRLKTFMKWPHNEKDSSLSPDKMAAAGFYLAPAPPRANDRVICHSCGLELVS